MSASRRARATPFDYSVQFSSSRAYVSTPLPHDNLERLDEMLTQLSHRHEKVWYLCDGSTACTAIARRSELWALQERHPALHLYVDDAHGVSWTGKNGAGTVLGFGSIRSRTVVALGLSRAFAAAGAVFVFSDEETRSLVRACGSTLIFSGPLQPGQIGAGIASAQLHLSGELQHRQSLLSERIQLFNELSQDCGLRLGDSSESPVRFLGIGAEEQALDRATLLIDAGLFTNLSVFPAVPRRRAGIRVMLTTHHTEGDVCEARSHSGERRSARRAIR